MAKKGKKKYTVIEVVLILLIIACIGCYISFGIYKSKLLIPDYAPGEIDINAIKEEDKKESKTTGSEDKSTAKIMFSNVVAINKKSKKAKLYFKNPGSSTENMVLYLIIRQGEKETVLGKSKLIPAGYAIYEMELDNISSIQKGGYEGILKSVYYNEKTNVKEMVDTEIKVSIEVE